MRAASELLSLQTVRFGLVGVVNTLAGLAVIYLLKWMFSTADLLANLAGYLVGLTIAFWLNGRWTFAFRGPLRSTLWRFAATIGVAYCANLVTVSVALHYSVNSYIAQAAGVVPYAVVGYCGSKYFVFNARDLR